MPNLNRVFLMGNLTHDPELRVTPKGTSICQFSLAINRQFKLESGESREEAIFVDCEAWGKSGEIISKYVTKGRPLYVEGRLRLDQWEDKNTKEKRSRMKVVVEQFQFLGGKNDGGEGGQRPDDSDPSRSRYDAPKNSGGAKPASTENLAEDVPF